MKTFQVTADFRPTFEITARVEPFDEDVVENVGFLALEGGAGLLLQEDGSSRFLLENSVISITADSTIYTVDGTTDTADATFLLNTS